MVEAVVLVFLLFSPLLMREFIASSGDPGRGLISAIADVLTPTNFVIALASALIGTAIIEYLRKRS